MIVPSEVFVITASTMASPRKKTKTTTPVDDSDDDSEPFTPLATVWDCEFIKRFTEDGSEWWKCLHCSAKYRNPSAPKVVKHLSRVKNNDIKCCGGRQTTEQKMQYADLYRRFREKKNSNSTTKRRLDDVLDSDNRDLAAAFEKSKEDKKASSGSGREIVSMGGVSPMTNSQSLTATVSGATCFKICKRQQ